MKLRIPFLLLIALLSLPCFILKAQNKKKDMLLEDLMSKDHRFDSVLAHASDLKVQVIYTQVNRNKKGKASLADHFYRLDDKEYYYPASTVKLPIAILALQKLNELNIAGLDKNTTMITGSDGDRQTEVCNDPNSADGRPTIAQYIKRILLVSDNDAFNRLYEFLGQEYINNTLHRMGYSDVQIIHRLDIILTEQENRHTNPVSFYDNNGKMIYFKAPERSNLVYAQRDTRLGDGYMRAGTLIKEPMDFSKKNRLPLSVLHNIVRAVIMPESLPAAQRFNLTTADYEFLRKYMSMMPQESVSPSYDSSEYFDTYVKFLYYGAERNKSEKGIRIFNKPGDAYGFLIDAAFITDHDKGVEFFLSAVIYCNSDGILNDDHYDYATVGLPFMKNLGHLIYEYELKRKKKHRSSIPRL